MDPFHTPLIATHNRSCVFINHLGTKASNLTQSIRNNTVLEPLILYLYINGSWVIAYIRYWTSWLEKTAVRLWLNGIYIQPVTCRKGPKVPFAVTRHKWFWLNNIKFWHLPSRKKKKNIQSEFCSKTCLAAWYDPQEWIGYLFKLHWPLIPTRYVWMLGNK